MKSIVVLIGFLLCGLMLGCTTQEKKYTLEELNFSIPISIYNGSGCTYFEESTYPSEWRNVEPSLGYITTKGCVIGMGSPEYYKPFGTRATCVLKDTVGSNINLRYCVITATRQIVSNDGTIGPLEKVIINYEFDIRNLKNEFYYFKKGRGIVNGISYGDESRTFVIDKNIFLMPLDIIVTSVEYKHN